MSIEKDNDKRVALSPDDTDGNIKLATESNGKITVSDIDNLSISVLGGLYLLLILTAIFRFTSVSNHFLWIFTLIIVLVFYIYSINSKLNVSILISGSLSALAAYFYSTNVSLLYPMSYMPSEILKVYLYALVFCVFGLIYSYLLRNKGEKWQIMVSVFLITFIINSCIM